MIQDEKALFDDAGQGTLDSGMVRL